MMLNVLVAKRCTPLIDYALRFSTRVFVSAAFTVVKSVVNVLFSVRGTVGVLLSRRCFATLGLGRFSSVRISIATKISDFILFISPPRSLKSLLNQSVGRPFPIHREC